MCLQKTATLEKQKQSVPSVSRNNTKKERERVLLSSSSSSSFERAKCRRRRRVIKDTREKMCNKSGKKKTSFRVGGEEDLYCEASLSFGLNTKRRRRWKKYARKKKDLKKKKKKKKKKKSHRTFDSPPTQEKERALGKEEEEEEKERPWDDAAHRLRRGGFLDAATERGKSPRLQKSP